MGPARYLVRRLVTAVLSVLGLAAIVFAMLKVIPGDEAQVAAGEGASPEQVAAMRATLGLDDPWIVQFGRFLARLAHGDLGTSTATRQPVATDIATVLPGTLELGLFALVLALLVAVPPATVAAARRGGAADGASRIAVIVLAGLPTFWLALLLQWVLGAQLRLLPISGRLSVDLEVPRVTGMTLVDSLLAGNGYAFYDGLQHLLLPAACLAVPVAAQLFRVLRAELVSVLSREHVLVATAKGVPTGRLLRRHALPNAAGPLLTLTGLEAGILLASAVLVESIFGLSGVGAYLQNAVDQRDLPAVLGCVVVLGSVVVGVNLVVDIVQMVRDPRIRSAQLQAVPA